MAIARRKTSWFSEATLLGLIKLGGIECYAPGLLVRVVRIRKVDVAGGLMTLLTSRFSEHSVRFKNCGRFPSPLHSERV
jgi:hypothetical protein